MERTVTKVQKHQKIKKLQDEIYHLSNIAKEDEYIIKRLKSFIDEAPIQRLNRVHIDLDLSRESIFTRTTAEYYGALLYVREHKKQVDKLLCQKHKELKNMEKINV